MLPADLVSLLARLQQGLGHALSGWKRLEQVMGVRGDWQNIELQADDVAVLVGRMAETASAGVLTAAPSRVVGASQPRMACTGVYPAAAWHATLHGHPSAAVSGLAS